MRALAIPCAVALLLSGCTYHLGYVQPQAGKSVDDQQLATLVCKDKALLVTSETGYQAGQFLMGLTIIGTPIAKAMERQTQRDSFTECMTAKGYAVAPAND